MSSNRVVRSGQPKAAPKRARFSARRAATRVRSATFGVLGAVALAACGGQASEPDVSASGALSPSLAGHAEDGAVEKALFGPNEFAGADNCSASQRATVFAAESLANVLIGRAQDALAEVYIANDLGNRFTGSDPVFEGHFGPLNETTWTEVYDRYIGISVVMPSNVYSCNVDGDVVGVGGSGESFICGSASVIAVTNPSVTSVRLCPDFFTQDESSRAATLIHETSHQNRSYANFGGVGTKDLNEAVPFNAHRISGFAQRFNCTAGSPRCPTVF